MTLAIAAFSAFMGVVYARLYARSRRFLPLLASVGWFAFAVLEVLIDRRIACDAECNIRVDLVLLPLPLLILSAVAFAVSRKKRDHA